jgi:CRISPR-associated protein Cmr5
MSGTLEQLRMQSAWQACTGQQKDYENLAKSVPALVMNSGLVQTMAFLEDKGRNRGRPHGQLAKQLRAWICQRYPAAFPSDEYSRFMDRLVATDPGLFREITTEAMAWLRWVRQLAPASAASEGGRGG